MRLCKKIVKGIDLSKSPAYAAKRSDLRKGAETLGRELSLHYQTTWLEFWPFLNKFCDLSSADGLRSFEDHLLNQKFKFKRNICLNADQVAAKLLALPSPFFDHAPRTPRKKTRTVLNFNNEPIPAVDNFANRDTFYDCLDYIDTSNSEASIDLETSSGDDIFTTPPETPPCVYINGSSLSRDDLDALSAIKALNVDPDEFPLIIVVIFQWKKAKKNNEEKEVLHKSPHSFVFHRGKVGLYVRRLIRDVRRVMEPYTATKLKVLKKNVLKDFASVAGPLGVSHMVVFTRTTASLNMRLIRLPRGPTLTFRVHSYSLNRDIISSLRKAQPTPQKYFHHPLLVMNNFQHDQRHIKLMESTFQNMFPSINVNSVKLGDIKRCLLLNYDTESDTIEFRHYAIKLAPSGVSSSIKKLMKKKVPDMGKYSDISDFFLKPVHSSDSEYEGPPGENEVELPENVKTKAVTSKVGIKLTEIGPRMKLQLIKLQDGFCGGEVLYHKFIHKSAAQKEAARKTKLAKDRLREKRRKEQEENVKRKNAVQSEEVARKRVKFKVETSNASTAETT
uniref:Brix domain-containing protein n=1 Tax=Romanomermis culicivorax TaxID=13658 RepID=A0A915K3M1_ROMCU